ncbi:MAG: peptidylprolyl isomerase, partial [Planctomycetota bacterium]
MPLQIAMLRPWMMTAFRRWTTLLVVGLMLLLEQSAFAQNATGQNAAVASSAVKRTNSIVATVNADPITEKVLADEVIRRHGEDILEVMVNRYLILQACKDQGIEVTKDEVREEIARAARLSKLDMSNYLKLLEEERNISANEYSKYIVWPMLALRRLVADQIEVTEDEFNKQYLARYGEAVKCRMIMVSDRGQADSICEQAQADPVKFEALAKKFSVDEASASMGGLIPAIRRYTGDAALEDAVFALSDGGVSDVMPLGDQWVILQAVRRIPPANPQPQAIPAIREQITSPILAEKTRVAAGQLFQELQREANVVKVLGDTSLMKQHPGVAALINGQALTIAQVAEEAVQRHGADVLEGEINRKLLTQALKRANIQVTSEDLTAESRRAAITYGFIKQDGTADMQAWIDTIIGGGDTTQELYIRDALWPSVALRKLVAKDVKLTKEELQRGYESAYGPKAEVLAIVLGDQRTAQKVWQMARDNPTEAFFGSLAEQYSVEPSSASNSGMVPPIRKHGGQPTIEKEAFSLKPGELSGIVVTGDQFIILRCLGFTEPVVSDFEAIRE